MSIVELSALELVSKVKNKQISAMELVEAHIEQVEAVDGVSGTIGGDNDFEMDKVHSFITKTYDLAKQQANLVDQKIAAGVDPGLMAGVPVTIKDIFCLENTPTTAASKMLANFVAPYTATSVQRLIDAGALVIGKVNLDEFVFGSSNESSAYLPHPRNPWDTSKVPGGSSGGAASAVAAYECPISLGSDTSGSIRLPAAYCGAVGLKPTYGRVSRYGLIAFGSSLDNVGPLSRNVPDAALALSVMAGKDDLDSTSVTLPVPDYLGEMEKDIRGLRIGLSADYLRISVYDPKKGLTVSHDLPDKVKNEVYRSAEILAKQGAEIIENVAMPKTKYGIPAYFVISRVEAASNLHRFDGVKYGHRTTSNYQGLTEMYQQSRAEGFGLQPKLRILMGMYVSAAQYSARFYERALKIRTQIRQDFDTAFKQVDLLLTPSTPAPAFGIGGVFGDSIMMQYADQFLVPANHAGLPAISLPSGLDEDGLPLSIHFIANDFREDLLFRAGFAFERLTAEETWRSNRPTVMKGGQVR